MKVQCSIKESPRRSLTESPIKALQGNQDYAGFVFCQASARSGPPAFNCASVDRRVSGPVLSGDPIADAKAYLNFYLRHNWWYHDWRVDDDDPTLNYDYRYEENDDQDSSTFLVSMNQVQDTYPGGFWNSSFAPYANGPQFDNPNNFIHAEDGYGIAIGSSGSNVWDPNPTFNSMRAAVNGVRFDNLWARIAENCAFQFDRATTGNPTGQLNPYLTQAAINGLSTPISGTGSGIGYSSATNNVGGISVTQLNYTRAQVQIRNFVSQIPIPYNFYELITVINPSASGQPDYADGTRNGNTLADVFYRFRGGGFFVQNNQIVEIPIPSIDNPPTIIDTPFGQRVVARSDVWIFIAASLGNYVQMSQVGNRILPAVL